MPAPLGCHGRQLRPGRWLCTCPGPGRGPSRLRRREFGGGETVARVALSGVGRIRDGEASRSGPTRGRGSGSAGACRCRWFTEPVPRPGPARARAPAVGRLRPVARGPAMPCDLSAPQSCLGTCPRSSQSLVSTPPSQPCSGSCRLGGYALGPLSASRPSLGSCLRPSHRSAPGRAPAAARLPPAFQPWALVLPRPQTWRGFVLRVQSSPLLLPAPGCRPRSCLRPVTAHAPACARSPPLLLPAPGCHLRSCLALALAGFCPASGVVGFGAGVGWLPLVGIRGCGVSCVRTLSGEGR